MRRPKFILIIGLLGLLLLILASVALSSRHQYSISVHTDTTPLKLQLNDQSYTLQQDTQTLSVKSGVYKYRATARKENKDITVTGKVDLSSSKSTTLKLNFSLFTNQAISEAICNFSAQDQDTCQFQPAYLRTVYLESYSWAVVYVALPGVEPGLAVLHTANGSWVLDDGPGTDIAVGGYYPTSVEEVIQNAQQ